MKRHKKHRRTRSRQRRLVLESLELRSLLAADLIGVLQNAADPEDVDDDGSVTATDALVCINQLNSERPGEFSGRLFHDVDGDRSLSPNDALRVINRLNDPQSHNSTQRPRPNPPASDISVASLDGTGNNIAHPDWGSAGSNLLRQAPAAYADGVSTPSGADRPSAREISNAVAAEDEELLNERHLTAMVYAWGQFLDHDVDLTPGASPAERFNIPVPSGDPQFDPAGTGTQVIPLKRSLFDTDTGVTAAQPRQQVNTITAFIDASQVYGSDSVRAAALRTFVGGQLKTDDQGLLPRNEDGLENANDAHLTPDDQMFLAGDVRANENVELTSLHALFVREHNRLATEIAASEPKLSDEQIYQRARAQVRAEMQAITYNEFLPALLGTDALRPYAGYRSDVNAGITNEFSTAAFRVGHTLLGNDVEFLDTEGNAIRDEVPLREAFFNPNLLRETGIDPILNYLAAVNAREVDTQVVDDVRNFLFGPPGAGGFDLASLNIQRGRDHGLADYNTTRAAYGLPRVTEFDQITSNVELQVTLRDLYGSVDSIDLWVGGLAEDHVPGASVGPTFRRILVDQFERLRDGDRFWYENTLRGEALRAADSTTLAEVIRRSTDATNVQDHVFFDPSVLVVKGPHRQAIDIAVVGGNGTVDIVRHQPTSARSGDRDLPAPSDNQASHHGSRSRPPVQPLLALPPAGKIIESRPVADVAQVIVRGADFRADQVMVDFAHGELPMPDGVVVEGGAGAGDVLRVRGTQAVDAIMVEFGRLTINDHVIAFSGIEELHILASPGVDDVRLLGDLGIRVIVDREPVNPPPRSVVPSPFESPGRRR